MMRRIPVNIFMMISVISFMVFLSCKECPNITDSSSGGGDIIFSGKALNSNNPGIFTVKLNGDNLTELVENGVLFSPASNDNNIVFWSKRDNNNDNIQRYNIEKNAYYTLIDQGTFPVINYPVISKDGKHIAFFSGFDELVVGSGGPAWATRKYDICPNTIPVFSPDSKFLAFLEGDSLEAPLRINVVSSDDPGRITASKEISFGINGQRGEATLDWTHQDVIVYCYTVHEKLDHVGVWFIENDTKSYTINVANEGAYNPIVSPDKTKIVVTDKRGNLWKRNFTSDTLTTSWEQLTSVGENEYILNPVWSSDGNSILYTKRFKNNADKFSGNLEIIDIKSEKTRLICNNVYRGYWKQK
ncbi:hypothetical protein D9V86_12320 [Bacteroidetes/Chlorobi group bacterium ChocPot_Mid]|nr:MAG: hypothetical protein D9V86_12320 [Bacteroidetes/Chlorobi group bacterium ChocPot_Mid]